MGYDTSAIRGMLLPIPTVFDGEGEVDESLMREMVQHYVEVGMHALFVNGSYGQGPAMREDQRKRVAELVLDQVRGRIPVVIHVGSVDPYSAVELGLHARSKGADAIGLVGPYYYADRTHDELLLHFKMVDARVQLPILVYNNPQYQGYAIKPPLMQRLVAEVPRIFGAKLAMGTLDEAVQYLEEIPGFATFALANELVEGMPRGIRGTVSPPLAAIPELGVALIEAIDAGDHARARQLQEQVRDVNDTLVELWKQFGRAAFGESLIAGGFPVKQYPRWPTPPLPERAREEVRALIQRVRSPDSAQRTPVAV